MNRETMEYSLNQNIIFYGEDMLRGKLSEAEYAKVSGKKFTGTITGHFSDNFLVKLDFKLSDGCTAVLVPADACRPLTCHWCQDSKLVNDTPFTMGQYESGTIPMKECPYCKVEIGKPLTAAIQ